MRTTTDVAARALPHGQRLENSAADLNATDLAHSVNPSAALVEEIMTWLDEAKAENIVAIDLVGKSTIGDYMLIATGRSDRHVGAIADTLQKKLREHGHGKARLEGKESCDWVLIDTGDIIVHVFRPEVREFYKLEKMWSGDRPVDETAH